MVQYLLSRRLRCLLRLIIRVAQTALLPLQGDEVVESSGFNKRCIVDLQVITLEPFGQAGMLDESNDKGRRRYVCRENLQDCRHELYLGVSVDCMDDVLCVVLRLAQQREHTAA